jgi:hypothetical protein
MRGFVRMVAGRSKNRMTFEMADIAVCVCPKATVIVKIGIYVFSVFEVFDSITVQILLRDATTYDTLWPNWSQME